MKAILTQQFTTYDLVIIDEETGKTEFSIYGIKLPEIDINKFDEKVIYIPIPVNSIEIK